MTRRIPFMDRLAVEHVGDGKSPNLYFVSDGSAVVMVARDFDAAYSHWRALASARPLRECSLEDRRNGCLASVEPESDEKGARLITIDDTWMLKLRSA